MRILYLSSSYVPSRRADSVHVMKMCAAMARRGHAVTLVAKRSSRVEDVATASPFDFYGVTPAFDIVRILRPQRRGGSLLFSLGLLPLLACRRARTDLVYARDLVGGYLAGRLFRLHTLFEAHGLPNGRVSRWLLPGLCDSPVVSRVVVISQALRELLRPYVGARAEAKMVVAHDAADPLPASTSDRLPGSRTSAALQVGYVGHLYRGRGVELILELARRLPQFEFHLIGGNERELTSWRARGERPNVTLHGFVAPGTLSRCYQDLDVLLMPYQRRVGVQSGRSDTAAWMSPMKMFEYMASGKAIVSSDLPVLREVLVHDQSALLVSPDDVDEWEAVLLRLAARPDLRQRLGQAARQAFEAHYTWDARAEKVLDALQR